MRISEQSLQRALLGTDRRTDVRSADPVSDAVVEQIAASAGRWEGEVRLAVGFVLESMGAREEDLPRLDLTTVMAVLSDPELRDPWTELRRLSHHDTLLRLSLDSVIAYPPASGRRREPEEREAVAQGLSTLLRMFEQQENALALRSLFEEV